ncbi:MATE family efflux transporter [Halioglobus sp.]|nr:MATE family efflux transporter [Halioglobus sp.]
MNSLSLTTLRELLRLSLPMVVSQGAFAAMIFTDRLFMSFIDSAHIAAALGGGVASFVCFSLFMGLITYANALVAQYYGTGEYAKCPRVVTQGILIALASAPLLLLMGWYGGEAFKLMGHDSRQVPLESLYFQILMGGSVFTLIKACLASYFSGIGRTRVVMVADLLGALLNIPLSWMLIFGKWGMPEMGIAGAGLGTIAATLFSTGVFLLFYLSKTHRLQFSVKGSLVLDRSIMRRYLRLGMPSGLESFMNIATFNMFLLLFQSYGVVQGAAMAIVFNWDFLSFIPMIGLNIGVMSMIGRFVGAGEMGRTSQIISSGFIIAFSYSGILAIFFLLFRVELVEVFNTGEENFADVRILATQMMIGLVTYMLADATILISGGVLRGAGDTRWIMVTSTSVHWLMLIAQYLVIVVYGCRPLISWWIFVVMLLVLAMLYLYRLAGGKWRHPERLARVMQE